MMVYTSALTVRVIYQDKMIRFFYISDSIPSTPGTRAATTIFSVTRKIWEC